MPHNTLTPATHDLTEQQRAQPTLLVNDHQHSAHSWLTPNAPLGRIRVIASALAADPPQTRWYELHAADHHLRIVDRPLLLLQLLAHAERIAPLERTYWWLPSNVAQVAGYQADPGLQDRISDLLSALNDQHAGDRGLPLWAIAAELDAPLLATTVAAHQLVRTGRAVPQLPSHASHVRMASAR